MSSLVLEEVIEHGPLFDEFEDEAWWSGVDIVDTALRPWPPEAKLNELQLQSESSDMDDDFCSVFSSDLTVPCSVIKAIDLGSSVPRLPPPPPVPPFMTDVVKQINELQSNNEECLLCQWAALNGTDDLLPSSGKLSFSHSFFLLPSSLYSMFSVTYCSSFRI